MAHHICSGQYLLLRDCLHNNNSSYRVVRWLRINSENDLPIQACKCKPSWGTISFTKAAWCIWTVEKGIGRVHESIRISDKTHGKRVHGITFREKKVWFSRFLLICTWTAVITVTWFSAFFSCISSTVLTSKQWCWTITSSISYIATVRVTKTIPFWPFWPSSIKRDFRTNKEGSSQN